MQDARCAASGSVLLSTALVKPADDATAGDPVGIYPHGRVPLHPSHKLAGAPAREA